jgi:membrane-bound lytic murein transglycosylase F
MASHVTWLRLAVAGIAFGLLGTCAERPGVLDQIHSLGELRVATRNSPTAYYLGANGPEGPEYDLVTLFARALSVPAVFITFDSNDAALEEVASGRAHLAAAGLVVTDRALAPVDYARPYQDLPQHIVYRKDAPRPDSLQSLIGRRVGVVAGSVHAAALGAAAGSVKLTVREFKDADTLDLLDRVSDGTLDATVADSNEFAMARNFHPELRIAFNLPAHEELAWAVARGESAMLERIDRFLAASQDGLAEIVARYYAEDDRLDAFVGSRNFVRDVQDRLPKYRSDFQQVAAAIGEDWRVLAAIGYQESKWDPDAVSPTGVKGLMMLQADTAASLGVHDRNDPRASIEGGARYLHSVRMMIPERVREPDRTWLALAAYNVGYGHVEDARVLAQTQGRNPDAWQDVRAYLPLLAQERWYSSVKRGYARGWEAVRFVDNVRAYLDILDWLAPDPTAAPPTASAAPVAAVEGS